MVMSDEQCTCANCKHWNISGPSFDHYNGKTKRHIETEHRFCRRILDAPGEGDFEPPSVAAVIKADDGAELFTLPTFGCTLFESRHG